MIVTSDGWVIGTGGAEGSVINKKFEKLGEKMILKGKIQKKSINSIRKYLKKFNLGHFVIKAPNGKYSIVWSNGVKSGKLKSGQYISVPNLKSYFRIGNYAKFDSNPLKSAVKIGATDKYGINRRDITVYHWQKPKITVYASNDDGKLVGMSTAKIKDNIYFKNKFINKNKLPIVPDMIKIGTCVFK